MHVRRIHRAELIELVPQQRGVLELELAAASRMRRSSVAIAAARRLGSRRSSVSATLPRAGARSVRASATWVDNRTSSVDFTIERGTIP